MPHQAQLDPRDHLLRPLSEQRLTIGARGTRIDLSCLPHAHARARAGDPNRPPSPSVHEADRPCGPKIGRDDLNTTTI